MFKNTAIVGAQFGDESKARITHDLSKNYDWVIRWAGGANAGHTIYRKGKKYVHHLLPSVNWDYNTKAFLSLGMAIDPEELLNELIEAEKDFPGVSKRIYIDPAAVVVFPSHKEKDRLTNSIGTTNKGIGPAYQEKYARAGFDFASCIYGSSPTSNLIKNIIDMGVQFKSVYEMLPVFHNSKLLFEGAQGVLLDINHGTFPYVTCSDTTLSGIGSSGFSSLLNTINVIGIAKAYLTRVGSGPFPTAIDDENIENDIRLKGNEFGATTGRARGTGWLDLPALCYACDMSAINEVILTKFDVLFGMESVKVCTSYKMPIRNGKDLIYAVPNYAEMQGWKDSNDQNLFDFILFVNNHLMNNTIMKTKVSAFTSGLKDEDFHIID